MNVYKIEVISGAEIIYAVTIAEEEEEVRDQLVAWGVLPDKRRYDIDGVDITRVNEFTEVARVNVS